jgi:hypothetical protein
VQASPFSNEGKCSRFEAPRQQRAITRDPPPDDRHGGRESGNLMIRLIRWVLGGPADNASCARDSPLLSSVRRSAWAFPLSCHPQLAARNPGPAALALELKCKEDNFVDPCARTLPR